jgi:ferric-dicitrate binding protein FerR (iron transport regulator)
VALEQKHIDLIITRYLSGEATAQEALWLDDWRAQSADNERYFAQYLFINDKTLEARPVKKFDTDKAWKNLHSKMQQLPEPQTKKQSRIIPLNKALFIRIAAVLLLLIGIASVFSYYQSYSLKQSLPIAFVSTDSVKNLTLADNSTVFLNKNSKITYSKNFGKKDRRVKLEGEAFFDVQHSEEKPFTVETQGTYIQDIGTAFNIKAKVESNLVEVYVENGEVKFFTQANEGILLTRGEKGVYNKLTGSFSKIAAANANAIAYKTRRFVFDNTPMSEVIETLSIAYNVDIQLKRPELAQCRINVSFDNEDINAILTVISETIDGQFEETANGYLIDGKRCAQ